MVTCDDLRIGGTITPYGIAGGLSINSTGLMVADWSDVLNSAGWYGSVITVNGRAGGVITGDRLPRLTYPILRIRPTDFEDDCLSPTSPGELLQDRTDDFLTILASSAEEDGVILELDLPQGTRWKRVWAVDPQQVSQPADDRIISAPLVADPYWHDEQPEAVTVNGAAVPVTVGGRRPVYDAVFTFSGDGTISHDTEGWEMEIAGSTGAVTVDTGRRLVLDTLGADASGLFRRTRRDWAWLLVGSNSLTSTVSVDIDWFPQYA